MKIRCKFRFPSSRVLLAVSLSIAVVTPRISESQSKTPTPKLTVGKTPTISAPTATVQTTSLATMTAAPIPTANTTQTPPRTPTIVNTVRTVQTPVITPTKTRCPTRTVAPTPSSCQVDCVIKRCPCEECKLICDPLTCTCELSLPQSSLPATLSEAAINGQPAASDVTNITQSSTIIKLSPSGPSMRQAISRSSVQSNPEQCGATPTPEPTNKSCPEILGLESLAQGWSMSVTVRREGPPPQPSCVPTLSVTSIPTLSYHSECIDETPTPAPTPGATPSGIYHEFVCSHEENGTEPFDECPKCETTPEPLLLNDGRGDSLPAPDSF